MIKYILIEWVGKWVICDPDSGITPALYDAPEEALNHAQKLFSYSVRADEAVPGEEACDMWVVDYHAERYGLVYHEDTILVWNKSRFRAAAIQLPPDLVQDETGQWVETPF